MSRRLDRLAADAYPNRPIQGALFARAQPRTANAVILVLLAVIAAFAALDWPVWLGTVTGSAVYGFAWAAITAPYVLVLDAPTIRLHGSPRFAMRVRLGTHAGDVAQTEVTKQRDGLMTDRWLVGDLELVITNTDSRRLAIWAGL